MKNIHDKFVKASFSDPGRAMAFFEKFLPEKIVSSLDLTTLQYLPESYLTDELKSYFSDMVFDVKLKNQPDHGADIVLLFEHKSSPDRRVLLQVGLYMFPTGYNRYGSARRSNPLFPSFITKAKRSGR